MLLSLVAHVAFADGEVEEKEFGMLEKLLPDTARSELFSWIVDVIEQPLDFDALLRALPTRREREAALRFVVHMAWQDGDFQDSERALLVRVREAFQQAPEI